MTIDCPMPHPAALLDNNGLMGVAWWNCIKAVHERTGGAKGVSSADMQAAIGNETAARQAADTALQAALTAEATARANGDSAEQAARQAADTYILNYAQGISALLHETITRGAAPLDSPHFTGDPTAPTPPPGDNDSSIATTAWVHATYAPLVSPFFGGTPAAPNPLAGDNDNSLATTAWTQNEIARFLPYPGAGVTWAAGSGAPTASLARGSLYSQVDGGVGSTLWVSQGGGSWLAVAGV